MTFLRRRFIICLFMKPTTMVLCNVTGVGNCLYPICSWNAAPISAASTAVILDDFQTILTQMMHLRHKDENDLSMECTTIDLRSLTDKYELLYFHDTVVHQSYCIFMTVSRHFPWGTVIVWPPSPSTIDADNHSTTTKTTAPTPTTNTTYHLLSIDCPHPLHDRGTGEMSIAIFKGPNTARSLVLAGAHRNAAVRHNHSTHEEPSCQGPTYAISDAAHSNQTGFHAAVMAIDQYHSTSYNKNYNNAVAEYHPKDYESNNTYHYTVIQFHGMGDTTRPGVDACHSWHGTSQ